MERKIGEIFEYNGEWCQCIVGNDCENCAFNERKCYTVVDNGDPIGDCCADRRKDNKDVIFKKLEKVGEPYTTFVDKTVQNYLLGTEVSVPPKDAFALINNEQRLIAIEIKQNKEDMEEKCDGCKYSDEEMRIIEKAEKEVRKVMGGELGIPEKTPYLSSFVCGALELGWLDKYKCQVDALRPFDLGKAKAGKPVCTRDGRKARIICFDSKNDPQRPIVALVEHNDNELLYEYTIEGKERFSHISTTGTSDLMMLPEKKEGWVNVAKDPLGDDEAVLGYIFNSYEDAVRSGKANERYVATVRIEWEG